MPHLAAVNIDLDQPKRKSVCNCCKADKRLVSAQRGERQVDPRAGRAAGQSRTQRLRHLAELAPALLGEGTQSGVQRFRREFAPASAAARSRSISRASG